MNYFDIIFLIALIFGGVRGFFKGLLLELTSFLSLAFGAYGAIRFSSVVETYLEDRMSFQSNYLGFISFGLTFLALVIGVSFIGKALTKIISSVGLGFFNKLLGAVFGALKFGVIVGALMLYFLKLNRTFHIVSDDHIKNAISISFLSNFEPDILSQLKKSKKKVKELF